MDTSTSSSKQRQKRTKRACEACKERKVKCTGIDPCRHCERRHDVCRYLEGENRISVSEAYLRRLERSCQASNATTPEAPREHFVKNSRVRLQQIHSDADTHEASPGRDINLATHESVTPYGEEEPSTINSIDNPNSISTASSNGWSLLSLTRNPLLHKYSFVRDTRGRFRFLGPSSTWSFSRRVVSIIEQYLPENSSPKDPINLDGAAYKLTWTRKPFDEPPDVTNLPSRDYAIYLFNTFTFNVGQLFRLVDEETFLRNLDEFYKDPPVKARDSRLWFAQFLLILAFGKALLAQSRTSTTLVGSVYAARGLALLPDFHDIQGDSLLHIELLCLAALYLHSLDLRITAFEYIGQALRLCFVEGLHREYPEEAHGRKFSQRCSNIWWTVYVLDQDFSSLMGAPSSIRDQDITVPLPITRDTSLRAAAATLQIRLTQLTARILSTVYRPEERLGGTFLSDTQQILRSLVEMFREVNDVITSRIEASVGSLSRMSTYITISYHRCIVLTTRPLVMWILQRSLELALSGENVENSLNAPIITLLQACVDSGTAILKLLRALADHDLLETFLPFHLEGAFSSAYVLYIIEAICPSHFRGRSWDGSIAGILDVMIEKGSATAKLRKAELSHLTLLLDPLMQTTVGAANPQAPVLIEETSSNILPPNLTLDGEDFETQNNLTWEMFLTSEGIGAAHEDMLQLVEQLDIQSFQF